MDGSRKWSWVFPESCSFFSGRRRARATDGAAALVHPRVGAVTALSGMPDGSHPGGDRQLHPLDDPQSDLHPGRPAHCDDRARKARQAAWPTKSQSRLASGRRRARIVWPPGGSAQCARGGHRDPGTGGRRGWAEPFRPEDFRGAVRDLPGLLYLAAPGHRSQIVPIEAPAVKYGSQWFLYRELSRGDSGGPGVRRIRTGSCGALRDRQLHRVAARRVRSRHGRVWARRRLAHLHQPVSSGA